MKLRNSTFFKYVISYVLVLSVAFVGFYAVVQFQLEREYRSVYQDETERKIQNISIVLDQDLSDILVMNYIIENNTAFIFARYSESSYDRYLAVSELKKLSMTNALVKDILYFDIQNEDVLSANTSVACKDGDYYLKTAAGELLIPPELIFEKSSENTLFALSIGETSFYFFPAAKNSSKFRTVFLLNDTQLHEWINTYATQEIDAVGLLSEDILVFSNHPESFSSVDAPETMVRSAFIADGKDSALYIQGVGALRLALIVRVNTGYFSDYATAAFEKSYAVIGISLGLGILLVFLSLKVTYLPLHALTKRITKKDSVAGNELSEIGRAFDETRSEKELLEAKIGYYKTMVKDSIRFTSADFSAFSDTQLDRLFSEDFYGTLTVAIIRFQSASTVLDWSEFLPPDGWTVIDLEACPKQRIILLWIPVMPNEGISSAEYYFQELAVKLPCSISYGDFSSNPLEIARLYDMAKQAQRYAGSTPVTSYASVRQLCEDQPAVQYPYQILDDLSICLRQLDFRKARDEISSIVSTSAAYPVLFVRCIYMDILSLLNTSMHAYSVRYEAYEPLLNEALRICRSMRAANDQTAICRSIQSILDKFEVESLSTGLQLPQVVAFVEEHCFKADFSLAYLANHFHVGPVYMSTFFTKRMNTTLTDYVWELRLQRAKYLLESTEESIDKISTKIGYDIPSSFRRKFKQETGTSPSEYRRTHHVN